MGVFIPASPHGTNPAHLVDVLRDYPDRFIGVAVLGDASTEEITRPDGSVTSLVTRAFVSSVTFGYSVA